MSKLLPLMALLLLSGCGVYKIEQRPITEDERTVMPDSTIDSGTNTGLSRLGETQCSNFFIVSMGLIPLRCVDTYLAAYDAEGSAEVNAFSVTTVQGWWYVYVMLFSPNWHAGYDSHALRRLEQELEIQRE